jgi:hypothetical protein
MQLETEGIESDHASIDGPVNDKKLEAQFHMYYGDFGGTTARRRQDRHSQRVTSLCTWRRIPLLKHVLNYIQKMLQYTVAARCRRQETHSTRSSISLVHAP